MAGEYDEKFKEVTQLLKKSTGGLDELRMEVRDIRSEVRDIRNEVRGIRHEVRDVTSGLGDNTAKLESLASDVRILTAQFTDVGVMAIKDHKRIDNLAERVHSLEAEVN